MSRPPTSFPDGAETATRSSSTTRRSPETVRATLSEVVRCTRAGITINTFMLDANRSLQGFVEQMTKLNRGRAFFTTPETLGDYVLVDFLEHRRTSSATRHDAAPRHPASACSTCGQPPRVRRRVTVSPFVTQRDIRHAACGDIPLAPAP